MVPSNKTGGKPRLWAVFWVKGLSHRGLQAQPPRWPWVRSCLSSRFQPLGRGCSVGVWVSFAVGQCRVPMPSLAAESSSPPALWPRFPRAWQRARPPFTAAFSFALIHCVSFLAPCEEQRESLFQQTGPIRSTRLRWSEGWKSGMQAKGDLPPLRGPRAACTPLPSKYGKRSA